jgi:HSP20 family molecular chaperone IbpA
MAQEMEVGVTESPSLERPMQADQMQARQPEGLQSKGRQSDGPPMTDRRTAAVEQGSSGQQAQGRQGNRQVGDRDDSRAMLPRCDVLEDSQGITLLADLPGVPRERLELKLDGETLTIEGAVSTAMPQQMEPIYVEVSVPRYRRAFTLSRELDTEKIEANLADGVLRLRIPKKAHAQPKKIAVQAS